MRLTEQQKQTNVSTDHSQSNDQIKSALTDDIRIIQASKKGTKQWFKILWPDNTKKWIHEPYVNKKAVHEYLKTHTRQGRKRKQISKFFVSSS
jgi:hypothetical protein